LIILNEKAAKLFSVDEVELIPVSVKSSNSSGRYYIAVIKHAVDCIDRNKSDFEIWEKDNNMRPDKAGEYRAFYKLVVDPGLTNGFNIFRIKGYQVAVVVSEALKRKIQTGLLTGVRFKLVS
jgi:hypothetical protein